MPVSRNRKGHKKAIQRRYNRQIQERYELLNQFRKDQKSKLEALQSEASLDIIKDEEE